MKWYDSFYCKVLLPVKQVWKKWLRNKKDDHNDHFDHPYIIL